MRAQGPRFSLFGLIPDPKPTWKVQGDLQRPPSFQSSFDGVPVSFGLGKVWRLGPALGGLHGRFHADRATEPTPQTLTSFAFLT